MDEYDDRDYDASSEVNEAEVDTSFDDSTDFCDDSFSEDSTDDLGAESQEACDDCNSDFGEDVNPDLGKDNSDGDEAPTESGNDSTNNFIEDDPNDLQSILEQSERKMKEAQAEAEAWADEQGMTEWSDGDARTSAGLNDFTDEVPEDSPETQQENLDVEKVEEKPKLEESETREQHKVEDEAEQMAALEADVKAQGEALNAEYADLMVRKQAAFDSTIDATDSEDRERFANLQYDLGEQMEQVRSKIIENNNRIK